MPPITLTAQEKSAILGLHQNFNSYIKFIAERTYMQKMRQTHDSANLTNFANRQFKDILDDETQFVAPKTGTIARSIHGLRHATRVAQFVKMLHISRSEHILDAQGQPDTFPTRAVDKVADFFGITPEDVLMLTQVAAFFHDSAREDEAEDKWDHRSAENCYDFLIKKGIKEDIARFFANAARYKSDGKKFNDYLKNSLQIPKTELSEFHYIRQLIAFSDTLDIMRCKPEFNGDLICKFFNASIHQGNKVHAVRVILEAYQLLAAQGDLFTGCNIIVDGNEVTAPHSVGDPNWDALAFEFSEDPWGYMQNYINNYIDQNKLQALPKTEPLAAASLNIPNKSLITECNWQELFATNDQFMFIKAAHALDQIGHIATKQEPSKSIINIKKDSIEFAMATGKDSLSEEQLLATIEILKGLIAQGKHDENNPLIMEPNHAFTVNMVTDLNQHIIANKIPVKLEMREFINEQHPANPPWAKKQKP